MMIVKSVKNAFKTVADMAKKPLVGAMMLAGAGAAANAATIGYDADITVGGTTTQGTVTLDIPDGIDPIIGTLPGLGLTYGDYGQADVNVSAPGVNLSFSGNMEIIYGMGTLSIGSLAIDDIDLGLIPDRNSDSVVNTLLTDDIIPGFGQATARAFTIFGEEPVSVSASKSPIYTVTDTTPVPLPPTALLFGTVLAGGFALGRKKKKGLAL